MLDANVCIAVMRYRPPSLVSRLEQHSGKLAISAIVHHELEYGVRRAANRIKQATLLDQMLSLLTVLAFDEAASVDAAEIKADLAAKGQLIGPNDLLIAGHARSRGLTLVTSNLREFTRVDGLTCEDWLGEAAS